ncbi:venom protease-like [Macrobrachium rosenbergii]|uniref:venom protease-like n=1 Tax=Macrobrachium rosenbergii TaxID=79674 RepID=UPI0034D58D9E
MGELSPKGIISDKWIDLQFGNGIDLGTGGCVPRGGGPGECRIFFSCPSVVTTFRRVRPALCGFDGIIPIVCCPKTQDSREQQPAAPKPKIILPPEPPTINSVCGHRSGNTSRPIRSDVVGGKEASPNSWPWMAVLGRFDRRGEVTWFCSGTLISPWFVLTAAHCVYFSRLDVVRLGDHNLRRGDVTSLDLRVADKIAHPEYRPPAATHDLALLRLSSGVAFTEKISPICLPWVQKEAPNLEGRKLTATGWGATSYGGTVSDVLREVVVTVFPNSYCDVPYSTLRDYSLRFPEKICGEEFICAGAKVGGKDACRVGCQPLSETRGLVSEISSRFNFVPRNVSQLLVPWK